MWRFRRIEGFEVLQRCWTHRIRRFFSSVEKFHRIQDLLEPAEVRINFAEMWWWRFPGKLIAEQGLQQQSRDVIVQAGVGRDIEPELENLSAEISEGEEKCEKCPADFNPDCQDTGTATQLLYYRH